MAREIIIRATPAMTMVMAISLLRSGGCYVFVGGTAVGLFAAGTIRKRAPSIDTIRWVPTSRSVYDSAGRAVQFAPR